MRTYLIGLLAIGALLVSVGCISYGSMPTEIATNVELGEKNFKVVKTNVVGTDTGFRLLGIIPINPSSLREAMEHLVDNSGIIPGDSKALVNLSKENASMYFILFSTPRVSVRADVVEFVE